MKYNAIIKIDFDGMKGKKYPVHEIVTSRVTINKKGRLIDFSIKEVEIKPIKLSPRIKHLILNKINPYK
jgi:hypothetical protein